MINLKHKCPDAKPQKKTKQINRMEGCGFSKNFNQMRNHSENGNKKIGEGK